MTTIAANQTFIIAAYAVTWLALLAYAARLERAGARTRAEYERAASGSAAAGETGR